MPIKYDEVMQLRSSGVSFNYTDRETMLYALGIGLAAIRSMRRSFPSCTKMVCGPCRRSPPS